LAEMRFSTTHADYRTAAIIFFFVGCVWLGAFLTLLRLRKGKRPATTVSPAQQPAEAAQAPLYFERALSGPSSVPEGALLFACGAKASPQQVGNAFAFSALARVLHDRIAGARAHHAPIYLETLASNIDAYRARLIEELREGFWWVSPPPLFFPAGSPHFLCLLALCNNVHPAAGLSRPLLRVCSFSALLPDFPPPPSPPPHSPREACAAAHVDSGSGGTGFTSPYTAPFLRLAHACHCALIQHLVESEDPRAPARPDRGALAAVARSAPTRSFMEGLQPHHIAGADRLGLYTCADTSALHAALAAGLPILLKMNVYPSFQRRDHPLCLQCRRGAPSGGSGAPKPYAWVEREALVVVGPHNPLTDGGGALGSATFFLSDLVQCRRRGRQGGGGGAQVALEGAGLNEGAEEAEEGEWETCALVRDSWVGPGSGEQLGPGAGRHAKGAWLLSAQLLASEKSKTQLVVLAAPCIQGLQ
jgi:hypothetical protein